MKFDIQPLENFVYRIPSHPVDQWYAASKYDTIEEYIEDFFSKKEIKEALYIASPDFYREVECFLNEKDYNLNEKRMDSFRYSALSYINRMCTRATPFGLFGACGVGNIGDKNSNISPSEKNVFRRIARLDIAFLCRLKDKIFTNLNDRMLFKYYTNNSLYSQGNVYRYVEYNDDGKDRNHVLTNIKRNPFLDALVMQAQNGSSFNELLKNLVDQDIDEGSAVEFINSLIDSKIILSELEPHIVSNISYEEHLLKIFSSLNENEFSKELRALVQELKYATEQTRDMGVAPISPSDYIKLEKKFDQFNIKSTQHFIQIDAEVRHEEAEIETTEIWNIKKGMKAYFQLATAVQQNDKIASFKEKFIDRYSTQLVRLVDLLDPEHGLNYGRLTDNQLFSTPIIDDIPVGSQKGDFDTLRWDNRIHYFLFRKIEKAIENKESVILTQNDINSFSFDQQDIPATLVAFVQMIPQKDSASLINFRNWGSDSATTILGRFTNLNPEIEDMVKDLADHEEECLPENKILAELNHLSSPKIGNITSRNRFRKFEIPYITKSNSIDEAGCININDLYIRINNGAFQVLDIKNKKQIIPMLSNAHNFSKDTLPIYRFLGDIQNESDKKTSYLSLNLGSIPDILDHIPRISFKNYIFRLATWKIRKKDVDWLWMIPTEERLPRLKEYLETQNLPLSFSIKSGDHRLFIDLEKTPKVSFILLTEELDKKKIILIEENPFSESDKSLVKNKNGNYFHELLIPFKNISLLENKSVKEDINFDTSSETRIFLPGSEWVYFKIYSGIHARQEIRKRLSSFVSNLKEKNLFDKWFYINYSDPETHLRVRFRVTNENNIGEIINEFYREFMDLISKQIIRKVQLDTYEREVERYGGSDLINAAESIFDLDSTWALRFLEVVNASNNKNLYWLLALRICDSYMNAFSLSLDGKKEFSEFNRNHFSNEYNANKTQRRKLLNKYKAHQSNIEGALEVDEKKFWTPKIEEMFESFELELKLMVDSLYKTTSNHKKHKLLISFIHMFLLRFLPAKNRKHEYFVYSNLEQFYRMKVGKRNALAKQNNTEKSHA